MIKTIQEDELLSDIDSLCTYFDMIHADPYRIISKQKFLSEVQ